MGGALSLGGSLLQTYVEEEATQELQEKLETLEKVKDEKSTQTKFHKNFRLSKSALMM